MKRFTFFLQGTFLLMLAVLLPDRSLQGQIINTGCVGANFGVDAGLYSGVIEFGTGTPAAGTMDWFQGPTGHGIFSNANTAALQLLLQTSGNPTYYEHIQYPHSSKIDGQLLIDGLLARDHFGGTGWIDTTSFNTASKNGEDPAIWDPGPQNVLGKNDLIDVAGFMWRDGITLEDDLWFAGMINRAEPGGDAYMDFEFFVEEVNYNPATGFTSGGPDLGHTAFQFDASGNITRVGDFIFNVSLTSGGSTPNVEVRLWVSYADVVANRHPPGFTWGGLYDGAFTGSPFGYANIIPATPEICGIVNKDNQKPLAPPWGTKGTKANVWGTNYIDYSVVEVALNMTHFGIDHTSLLGIDSCSYPIHTFMVKSRASNSFTAQLKDFAGPFDWGQPYLNTTIVGVTGDNISCLYPIVTMKAEPQRTDVTYLWTTIDGHILGDPTNDTVQVDQPGTYKLEMTFANGCQAGETERNIIIDPTKPLFNTPTTTSTVACNNNSGTVNLTVSGGTAPFQFIWSNGTTTEDLSGLAAGTYTATITDANGCTITSPPTVVPPPVAMSVTPTVDSANCNGSATGSVTLAVTGKSPFTYIWSNGNLTQNISNLAAGTYTVTVTDADGCYTTSSATVKEPSAITISASTTDETDPTLNNGTATLTVTGGTSPYTYLWSNSSTLQNQTGLSRGTYTVTVTDANLCTAVASVVIYEPEVCNDGIDNDGDGLTDCYDTECTPSPPGAITPSNNEPCVTNTVTYSVVNNPALTGYVWSVPSGATINSGQGTNSISVTWNTATGGQICVRADAVGCLSNPTCITVVPSTVPPAPDDIIVH